MHATSTGHVNKSSRLPPRLSVEEPGYEAMQNHMLATLPFEHCTHASHSFVKLCWMVLPTSLPKRKLHVHVPSVLGEHHCQVRSHNNFHCADSLQSTQDEIGYQLMSDGTCIHENQTIGVSVKTHINAIICSCSNSVMDCV